jgi:hypothetical protein
MNSGAQACASGTQPRAAQAPPPRSTPLPPLRARGRHYLFFLPFLVTFLPENFMILSVVVRAGGGGSS